MGKYGGAAFRATQLFNDKLVDSPQEAWEQATAEQFPNSASSQKKVCPRGAFLGLCEEGRVKGIRPGHYTGSKKNKQYAIDAVELLEADPSLTNDENLLWSKVVGGEDKTPNEQMEVVLSLWNKDLINRRGV